MTDKPIRVQLSRQPGSRLPFNTVSVARPSKWANPYSVAVHGRDEALRLYRRWLDGMRLIQALDVEELRGRNLACWCRLDQACHGDILLDLANRPLPDCCPTGGRHG